MQDVQNVLSAMVRLCDPVAAEKALRQMIVEMAAVVAQGAPGQTAAPSPTPPPPEPAAPPSAPATPAANGQATPLLPRIRAAIKAGEVTQAAVAKGANVNAGSPRRPTPPVCAEAHKMANPRRVRLAAPFQHRRELGSSYAWLASVRFRTDREVTPCRVGRSRDRQPEPADQVAQQWLGGFRGNDR